LNDKKLLDLDNRKGKAPGGYQSTLNEARVPFIFMNAIGLQRDVETILHEAGHAFHAQAARGEDLYAYRGAPIEFCEVASMAMELLGNEFLEEFYPGNVVGQASSLSSSPQNNEVEQNNMNTTGGTPVPLLPSPFTPFDKTQPASIQSRHLPHWRQNGVTYFVTFRLADSLPNAVYSNWRQERETALRLAQQPQEAIIENFRERLESCLDEAQGECWLKNPEVAEIVEQALRHFDGERYFLGSYVIMPNHIHALVRPVMEHKLSEILHSWKSFTAKEANKLLGREGAFWQDESFDHIVRDEESLEKFGRYIQENPMKAGLAAKQFRLGVGQASSRSGSSEKGSTNTTGGTPVPLCSPEANRARKTHLEGIIGFFPWMATVDAFQHWIYTHPGHTRAERQAAYRQLMERFGGETDWNGFEAARAGSWHRQLHIFLHPFYYVEYGIAQLGALQVWANSKANKAKVLADYKAALALGGSRPLPELFSAAGCQFQFDAATIKPLIRLAEAELKKL
jgi:REP element-mobilizing transposase RayT